MKLLLALLFAVAAIGFLSHGIGEGDPESDPERPMCDHEDCKRLRAPAATRPAQGPDEIPGKLYRADVPPSGEPYYSQHHPKVMGRR